MAQMSKTKKPAGGFRVIRRMETKPMIPNASASTRKGPDPSLPKTGYSYQDKQFNRVATMRDGGRLTSSRTYKSRKGVK